MEAEGSRCRAQGFLEWIPFIIFLLGRIYRINRIFFGFRMKPWELHPYPDGGEPFASGRELAMVG